MKKARPQVPPPNELQGLLQNRNSQGINTLYLVAQCYIKTWVNWIFSLLSHSFSLYLSRHTLTQLFIKCGVVHTHVDLLSEEIEIMWECLVVRALSTQGLFGCNDIYRYLMCVSAHGNEPSKNESMCVCQLFAMLIGRNVAIITMSTSESIRIETNTNDV